MKPRYGEITTKAVLAHVTADVHSTAEIGNPPEMRDWWENPKNIPIFAVQLNEGVRIGPFVTIDAGWKAPTVIGARTWLLAHAHVAHDCVIGTDCELSSAVTLGGHVTIGDRVRIGLNATVLPFRTIGTDARVGAGSVVTHDIPEGEVWAGVPARPIEQIKARMDAEQSLRADYGIEPRKMNRE